MTTDTNAEKRAKKLETVRNLLARANHPKTPEPEAESCRAKADQLMTAFAIEQWQVESSDRAGERPKPEIRKVNIDWWYDTRDYDTAANIWWMFHSVARHCRVVVAERGRGKDGNYRAMPLIGIPSDLDWMDQLFTSLLLQLNRNLVVEANSHKTLAENVYAMRMSGMGWMTITRKLWDAGLVEPPKKPIRTGQTRYSYRDADGATRWLAEPEPITVTATAGQPWAEVPEAVRMAIKNRLAQVNRNYAREHGLERNYVRPDVYQRSFTEGFCEEVRRRLIRMRRDSVGAYDAEHGTGSMDLVVQDIYAQAVVLYDATFPRPKPDPNAKPRKHSTAVVREKARSYDAMRAGEREASKANLSNQPSERIGSSSPRLPRG